MPLWFKLILTAIITFAGVLISAFLVSLAGAFMSAAIIGEVDFSLFDTLFFSFLICFWGFGYLIFVIFIYWAIWRDWRR